MKIRIVKPGLLSTIQDKGRKLYLPQAVPVSGVMDALSARIANYCVGSASTDAVIEFTYGGAEFIAETDILITLSGEGAKLNVNGRSIPSNRPVFIPKGTQVTLVNNPAGSRSYLAVAGGWDVPVVLGSRSTYLMAAFGGFDGRTLKEKDELNSYNMISATSESILNSLKGDKINYPKWSIAESHFANEERKEIRVIPGREITWFNADSILGFLSEPYTLTPNCNRMGYHLQGKVIKRLVKNELLSTAVTPGTIQVTGDGNPVLLMADCQTTGGYPRIAKVAEVDMPLCAQLKPGDVIYFKEISWNEAEMLYIQQEKDTHRLGSAIRQKYTI
jgi:antagonist of KipI